MTQSNFYTKTGGLALMVIQHHGDCFSYVRAPAIYNYFPSWDPFVGLMKKKMCYVIAATHKPGNSSMTPFGILQELELEEAKEFSAQYFQHVMNDLWDANEEWPKIERAVLEFQNKFWTRKVNQARKTLSIGE